MKMICTIEGEWARKITKQQLFTAKKIEIVVEGPKKGETVTILGTYYVEGHPYYELAEWPTEVYGRYNSKYFTEAESFKNGYQEVTFSKIKVPAPSVN